MATHFPLLCSVLYCNVTFNSSQEEVKYELFYVSYVNFGGQFYCDSEFSVSSCLRHGAKIGGQILIRMFL